MIPLLLLGSLATEYQKEGVFSNGYSDSRVKENIFVITFRANEYTPPETVMKYALKRAEEVTKKHGYARFIVIDQVDTSKVGSKKHLPYPSVRLTIQCFH